MSSISRRDRLLPLESDKTFEAIGPIRVLVLPPHSSSAAAVSASARPHGEDEPLAGEEERLHRLANHVRHWWDSPKEQRRTAYRQWLKSDVHCTRVPIRMRAFPSVSLSDSGSAASPTGCPSLPPCVAVQQHIPLLSQYESLLCPALVCSPLYSPAVEESGKETALSHSSSPPRSEAKGSAVRQLNWVLPPPPVPLKTNRLLLFLAKRALEFCIPIHEVTLFFSLTLQYLDAAVHYYQWGRSHASLHTNPFTPPPMQASTQTLRQPEQPQAHAPTSPKGGHLLSALQVMPETKDEESELLLPMKQERITIKAEGRLALPQDSRSSVTSSNSPAAQRRCVEARPPYTALAAAQQELPSVSLPSTSQVELKSTLSPPQQHDATHSQSTTTPSSTTTSFSDFATALLNLKTYMIQKCPDRDQFLKVPKAPYSSNDKSNALASPSMYNLDPHSYDGKPASSTAAALQLLLLAADTLEQRRSDTISSAFPIGSQSGAWSPRDLRTEDPRELWDHYLTTNAELPSAAAVSSEGNNIPPSEKIWDERSGPLPRAARPGRPSGGAQLRNEAAASFESAKDCFIPFEPRGTSRGEHGFGLPPLPPDPLRVFFMPLWERVMERCVMVRGALPNVREIMLREATAQWKIVSKLDETIRQVNQLVVEQHNVRAVVKEKQADALIAAASSKAEYAGLLRLQEEKGRHQRTTGKDGGVQRRVEDGTLQSLGLRQSSFLIRAPIEVQWRWAHSVLPTATPSHAEAAPLSCYIGWRGAEGQLMQYGLPHNATLRQVQQQAVSLFQDVVLRQQVSEPSTSGRRSLTDAPPASVGAVCRCVEDLADFICRVGAPLRLAADPTGLLILSRFQMQFVRWVLQSERPELYLSCCSQGIMEWRVRGSSRTVALMYLRNSGKEALVGTPSQLASTSETLFCKKEATSSSLLQRHTEGLERALRMVWHGGYDEAQAYVNFLYRVRKSELELAPPLSSGVAMAKTNRPGDQFLSPSHDSSTIRSFPVLRLLTQPVGLTGTERQREILGRLVEAEEDSNDTSTVQLLEVVGVRRSEESTLYRLLQSHADVLEVLGCGARRFYFRATDGQLLLLRQCGMLVCWSLESCFQSSSTSGLRRALLAPRRAIVVPGTLPLPGALVLPGKPLPVVTWPMVKGLLQHYFHSLRLEGHPVKLEGRPSGMSEAEPTPNVDGLGPSASAFYPRTVLHSSDRLLMLYVLRHHPQFLDTVEGCGIAEVFVSWQWAEAAPSPGASIPNVSVGTSETPQGQSKGAAGSTSTRSSSGNANQFKLPVLLIQLTCGRLKPCTTVSSCFLGKAPYTLQGYQKLVSSDTL